MATPSILLAVYESETVRVKAEAALAAKLAVVGQRIVSIQVNKKTFDIPVILLQEPERQQTVFFIHGLKRGGGKTGHNAYRALNIRREFLVDHKIRAVLWLTESEAIELPKVAPDFWSFRHRVVEFLDVAILKDGSRKGSIARRDWASRERSGNVDAKIALREMMLADLPKGDESESARCDLLYSLASLFWVKGDYKKSSELLTQCVKIAGETKTAMEQARIWTGLGIVYHDLQKLDKSINAYKSALQIYPRDSTTWSNLAAVYRDLGETEQAFSACKKSLELNPQSAGAWNNLGNLYRDDGRINQAIDAYEKSIGFDARDSNSWKNLGAVHYEFEHYDEAINAYERATFLAPKDSHSWSELARIYLETSHYDDALMAQKKAIRRSPKSVNETNQLGYLYQILGRKKEAIKAYRKSLGLDPQNLIAQNSLDEFKRGSKPKS